MLHELVKQGTGAKLRYGDKKYYWDGAGVYARRKEDNCSCYYDDKIVLGNQWQLDEPTVEDVLKERGYSISLPPSDRLAFVIHRTTDLRNTGSITLQVEQKPTTAAEATRIIDFLESLNK